MRLDPECRRQAVELVDRGRIDATQDPPDRRLVDAGLGRNRLLCRGVPRRQAESVQVLNEGFCGSARAFLT